MARLNIERQNELQPKRTAFAKAELEKLGYEIEFETDTQLNFRFNGSTVSYYPYSGWHSGATIKDGRGWENLKKQIAPKCLAQ